MKKIFKIAGAELRNLFYSPVAWLILVIFFFQTGSIFTDTLHENSMRVSMDYIIFNMSSEGFSLSSMQGYLYLYIPLLTMGIMSREFSSGSIKLLYASPVSNAQIILGKYLAIMIYGLLLVSIMVIFLLFGITIMPGLEVPVVVTGIISIYLLICAYAAVGLFMSSLTSYQVVAAMGTLAIFATLTFMGNMAQDVPFLRDITYWLSIANRTFFMLLGLICSEDVLYFFIVITMFLALTIARLQFSRDRRSGLFVAGTYTGIIVVAMLLGYITSRPKMMTYWDVSKTKINTLTPASQAVLKRLHGATTITSFVNIFDEANYTEALPKVINRDKDRFRHYLRFRPEIKMKYVYYYDATNFPLPPENKLSKLSERDRAKKICEILDMDFDDVLSPQELKKIVDLKNEQYSFVRVIQNENGGKTFLRIFNDLPRQPSEREITAAFKRLVMKLPTVGFLQGDGERDINNTGDRGYHLLTRNINSREALINQGFEVTEVNLSTEKEVPANINILVLADMNKPLSPEAKASLDAYIARGGNLIIAGDVGHQPFINPILAPLGVQMMEGQLIQQNKNDLPNVIGAKITKFAPEVSENFDQYPLFKARESMPGVTGLTYTTDKGFNVVPVLVSDSSGSRNELETTNFVDDSATVNASGAEKEMSYPVALALSRPMGKRTQKIFVMGDADCLSNSEIYHNRRDFRAGNSLLPDPVFYWMSDGEVPIDISRTPTEDHFLTLSLHGVFLSKIFFMGILPAVIALTGIVIWIRRKNR